ncbi:MAG TPA: DNA-formamidopyrimidine glycosylase family protein [Acidimicrobiales bacterium]|nr:DNA-formamidopyrimidine glycosylase family protein [Acidimicrobiales bacterium]
MPEGDTILRTARSLAAWLEGREVTAAHSRTVKAPLERVVGRRVVEVEARAKHLLIRFEGGDVLHTHMQLTGSWHRYSRGQRWRKPQWRAAAVLEAGDRVAVCFDAPVVELLTEREVEAHPAVAGLGPDVLRPPIDVAEVRRRAAALPPDTSVGDLLLDQRVVSGIGNIWRCEVLFVRRMHPWRSVGDVPAEELDALVTEAGRLMAAGRREPWVYGRAGRPCRRCGTPVAVERGGPRARPLYWCSRCQG